MRSQRVLVREDVGAEGNRTLNSKPFRGDSLEESEPKTIYKSKIMFCLLVPLRPEAIAKLLQQREIRWHLDFRDYCYNLLPCNILEANCPS